VVYQGFACATLQERPARDGRNSIARQHRFLPASGEAFYSCETGFGTERSYFHMATNIYVGNLAWSVTSDDLLELFSQYGKVVSAQVISDRETGRSRGFGFVEMESEEEAKKAIEALNGATHENRPLTVNIAKEREERRSGAGSGGGGYGGGGGGRRGGGGGGGGYGSSDRGRRY
jgi:hypothetical protein